MPPAPKNVKVRRTSPTSIEVSWDEPNFPVAGYKIFYNMFATPVMYVWQQMESGPYTVADITGLEPHTVYAVRVQAKSVDGRYGNLSETVTTDVKEVRKYSWDWTLGMLEGQTACFGGRWSISVDREVEGGPGVKIKL